MMLFEHRVDCQRCRVRATADRRRNLAILGAAIRGVGGKVLLVRSGQETLENDREILGAAAWNVFVLG